MNTHSLTQTKLIAAFKARDEMAATVSKFLIAHGGMSNGYETSAQGYVEIMMMGATVDTKLPSDDQLTGRAVRDRSAELSDKLRAIVEKHELPRDLRFTISNECDEYGTYRICVSLALAAPVKLY